MESKIGSQGVEILTLSEAILSLLRERHIVRIEHLLVLSKNDLKNRGFLPDEIDRIISALFDINLCLKSASC